MRGDSCITAQTVKDGPKISISFGVMAEPPDLPCREDVLVESGDPAPKSCLTSSEMRSSTAAGGLVPTGKTSTATETNFNQPPLRFHLTEETDSDASSKERNLRTSTQYALYDSSVFQESNLLPGPSGLRVIETKPMQNMTFDPDGSQGHLRACPSLGSWRALVCGEVIRAGAVFEGSIIRYSKVFRRAVQAKFYGLHIAFFRGRFADSSKQGQPKIRCAGKES